MLYARRYELLSAKPEGEAKLLAALVNKLGDPDRKLASKVGAGILLSRPAFPVATFGRPPFPPDFVSNSRSCTGNSPCQRLATCRSLLRAFEQRASSQGRDDVTASRRCMPCLPLVCVGWRASGSMQPAHCG